MAGVVLENVSRVFAGAVTAVARLSLEVRDGELLALLGPSGCGKTTTLRLIAGLDEPTSGRIAIGGRDTVGVPPRERNVALVFQEHALYPHLTAGENVAFPLELRQGGRWLGRLGRWLARPLGRRCREANGQIEAAVRSAAALVGIENLLNRWPDELSGGEAQRVALARALVRQPAVLLLDEPLSNADLQLRAALRQQIKRLHQQLACTTIYVTHDQTEALALGDRVAVMHGGSIQQLGPPSDVYDRPANRFVAEFIGQPPMNFLRGTLGTAASWVFASPAGQFAAGQTQLCDPSQITGPVDLGVRPEHLRLVPPTGAPLVRLRGVVQAVQPLGEATLLMIELAGAGLAEPLLWVAKTFGRSDQRPGEVVGLAWDDELAHYFDAGSGRNLASAGG